MNGGIDGATPGLSTETIHEKLTTWKHSINHELILKRGDRSNGVASENFPMCRKSLLAPVLLWQWHYLRSSKQNNGGDLFWECFSFGCDVVVIEKQHSETSSLIELACCRWTISEAFIDGTSQIFSRTSFKTKSIGFIESKLREKRQFITIVMKDKTIYILITVVAVRRRMCYACECVTRP